MLQARIDKETRCPELMTGRCRFVVVAIETGGRWNDEAVVLFWLLGCTKAREAPHHSMTHQVAFALERRWTRMLSTVCALSFAASLVDPSQCGVLRQTGRRGGYTISGQGCDARPSQKRGTKLEQR